MYKTYLELRQDAYQSIIDECMFISRASEGAVSLDWLMTQPIYIRKKYHSDFVKLMKEREQKLNNKNKHK